VVARATRLDGASGRATNQHAATVALRARRFRFGRGVMIDSEAAVCAVC
jgi:hypothetical protein